MNEDIRYKVYHKNFWGDESNLVDTGFVKSASGVLPVVFEYLEFVPTTVIDFGCGRGAWLFVCKELGTVRTIGIDGPWVSMEDEKIGVDKFIQHDLETPFESDARKSDLAICLEVAEHISIDGSDNLCDTLTNSSDNILFSSAPKGQGGEHHINEQSLEFWDALFEKRGFSRIKNFRKELSKVKNVDWWYINNTCLYKKTS